MKTDMPPAPSAPAQPHTFTVAQHFFQLLTDYTDRQALPFDAVLAHAGLRSADVQPDGNGRVPFLAFRQLCEAAAALLHDPCLGLRLGQSIRPGHLGSHGYVLMNCATALELAQQSARYSALNIDALHNAVHTSGQEHVRVLHSNLPGGQPLGRLMDELQHAIAVTFVRWITQRDDLSPTWVSFRHARPDDIAAYEALFRCPVRFGTAESAVAMDTRHSQLPLPNANPQLRRIMDDLRAQLIQQLGSALEPGAWSVARRAVIEAFARGMPEPGPIAQACGLSEDDLKKMLAARGHSFRSFVDELRQALALGYVRDPGLSLLDIAYLLGFSEQSAFQRAFKRWTGATPGDYRRQGTEVGAQKNTTPKGL